MSDWRRSIETTENLFSYGTLQGESVQRNVFGRSVEGRPAVLAGYKVSMIAIADESFAASSGTAVHRTIGHTGDAFDRVERTILKITRDELCRADEYELVEYKRVRVKLDSGENAWAYVREINTQDE